MFSFRDISRNALLSFRTFLYWTALGFCHAFVFFFGSYTLMGEDTTLMGNGQVRARDPFIYLFLLVFLSDLKSRNPEFPPGTNTMIFFSSVCCFSSRVSIKSTLSNVDVVQTRLA